MIARLRAAAAWLRARLWILGLLALAVLVILQGRHARSRAEAAARQSDLPQKVPGTYADLERQIRRQHQAMDRLDQQAGIAKAARAQAAVIVQKLEAAGHPSVAETIRRWNRG